MNKHEDMDKWIDDYECTYKDKILEVLKEKHFISVKELATKINPKLSFDEIIDISVSSINLEKEGLVETLFVLKMKNGTNKTFDKIENISSEDIKNSTDLISFLRLL